MRVDMYPSGPPAFLRGCLLLLVLSTSVKSDEQEILQISDPNQAQSHPNLMPLFESPEHAAIGDFVKLRYPGSTIQGNDFQYEVNNTLLSFGDIVALSGDFYYGYNVGDCAPAISNSWDTDRPASLAVASKHVAIMRADTPGILRCVRNVIMEQDRAVQDAVKLGKDPAQAYRDVEDKYNGRFATCYPLGYAILALCNWDHFGEDAAKAYSAVHTLALSKAREAFDSKKQSDLKEAYFIDAYGQHFLTDMFSTGHIRTPRRLLHSTKFDLRVMPADRCNKLQHDEDCASGLWVANREGESWAAYGDKHYSQGRSSKNRQMVYTAIQASVDEIWQTYSSGVVPAPDRFKALYKTPQPNRTVGINNFVPLFEIHPSDPSLMLYRSNTEQRAVSRSRQTTSAKLSNDQWEQLRKRITDSGPIKNMYVFTKSFVSTQQILHLGLFDAVSPMMVLNLYGTVDAGNYGNYWGMASQTTFSMAGSPLRKTWTDVRSLDGRTIALVGREGGQTKSSAIHIGLKIAQKPGGQLDAKLAWNDTVDDGNSALTPGQVLYGSFSNGSSATSMIKFFDGDKQNSKIELWLMSIQSDRPPVKIGSDLKTARLNFMISHKVSNTDAFSTVVGYARGNPLKTDGYWYFCNWQSDYKEPALTSITEPDAKPAQALLSDPSSGRIFRILYGKTLADPATIQIDILKPVRNVSTGAIQFNGITNSQKFPITWRALVEQNYLLWFVYDVNGDGHPDLVAYTCDQSNLDLNVVVFPSTANGTITAPVVSPIKLDNGVGTLLTAEFMQPLYATQAEYTDRGRKTSGAIMSFFDNYGIIGTRVVAPASSRGSFKYVFVGQDSSIAGQRSTTIGQRPQDWMGLRKLTEAIGIVPL